MADGLTGIAQTPYPKCFWRRVLTGYIPQDVDAGCAGTSNLVVSLNDGVLTDGLNRTGYIASNYQFQFDGPPQAGALYTAGYSVCANNSLALGSSAVFWECASGTFYNLYDRKAAEQCSPVEIIVIPCGGDENNNQGDQGNAQGGSAQTVGSEIITTTVVIPLSDGQPQVITTTSVVYICQIGDGKPFSFAQLPAAPFGRQRHPRGDDTDHLLHRANSGPLHALRLCHHPGPSFPDLRWPDPGHADLRRASAGIANQRWSGPGFAGFRRPDPGHRSSDCLIPRRAGDHRPGCAAYECASYKRRCCWPRWRS